MPIYTRRGDTGETGLAGGQRVKKDSSVIIFLGTLDELNASIGVAKTFMKIWPDKQNSEQRASLSGVLKQIQNELFYLGSMVAGAKIEPLPLKQRTLYWEQVIDGIDVQLPPLRNFILPGGSRVAALLHVARGVCRRTERVAVALSRRKPIQLYLDAVQYLNRLSDLLFILARLVNKLRNARETIWTPSGPSLQTFSSPADLPLDPTSGPKNGGPLSSSPETAITINEDTIMFEEHDALSERWE